MDPSLLNSPIPADTRRYSSVGFTLAHRLRRWTNAKPTLLQHLVSARITYYYIMVWSHWGATCHAEVCGFVHCSGFHVSNYKMRLPRPLIPDK